MLIVDIEGSGARSFLRHVLANDVEKLKVPGKALYTCMLDGNGGVIDDLIVYFFREDFFRLVVNAGTAEKDIRWLTQLAERGQFAVHVTPQRDRALLAIQGPNAREIFWKAFPEAKANTESLMPFSAALAAGMMVARTGYTGEDGFEIAFAADRAEDVWKKLVAAGAHPAGLGARDTLRLEAGMRLHGNDIDETTTAIEADLNWIVGWKKDDFIGAAALREQKASGAKRKIVGFEMLERGIARHGYDAYVGDVKAGAVTSGTQTPFLKKAIGMAYLPIEHTAAGCEFDVDVRGRRTRARVVPMPFYKRAK